MFVLCCLLYAGCSDKVVPPTPGPIYPPIGAAFSAAGGEVTFFSLITNEITIQKEISGYTSSAAFALVGSFLYIADNYLDMIAIYSLPGMERVDLLETGGVPLDLCLNRTANQIFLINANGNFRRYGRDDSNVDTLGVGLGPRRLALTPNEEMQTWIACRGDSSVYIVDLVDFFAHDTLHFSSPPSDICFTPDGATAFVALQSEQGVQMIDAHSLAVLGILDAGPGPMDLAINREGTILVASDSTLGQVRIWNIENHENPTVWDIDVGERAGRVRFSRGNTFYVMSREENHVVCVDVSVEPPEIVSTIDVPPQIREIALWETQP